jgi:hypothetical protein
MFQQTMYQLAFVPCTKFVQRYCFEVNLIVEYEYVILILGTCHAIVICSIDIDFAIRQPV